MDLPEPLIQNAKLLAGERGITFSEVVEDALRTHLSPRWERPRGKVRLPTVLGRLVNPELDLDRTTALTVAEDESFFAMGPGA